MKVIRESGFLGWPLQQLRAFLTAKMTVLGYHPLNKPMKQWMISQGMKRDAKSLTLQSFNQYMAFEEDDAISPASNGYRKTRKKASYVECEPDAGIYSFSFHGRTIEFNVHFATMEQAGAGGVVHVAKMWEPMEIVISCWSFLGGMRLLTLPAKNIARQSSGRSSSITKLAGVQASADHPDHLTPSPSRTTKRYRFSKT